MAAMALVAGLAVTAGAVRAQAQETKEKKVKDQGEFDLYNNVVKETDPAKKLQYLNQWVDKYPESDYYEEQLRFYGDLNQPAKVMELAPKVLAKNPKSFVALYLVTDNVRKVPNVTDDQLAFGRKSAQTLLDNLDGLKPANVSDDAWKQNRPVVENLAKGTIMWITTKPATDAVAKKDYVAAEQAFT